MPAGPSSKLDIRNGDPHALYQHTAKAPGGPLLPRPAQCATHELRLASSPQHAQ